MPSSLVLAGFLLSTEQTALGSACAQLNQMLAPQAMKPPFTTSNQRDARAAARKLFGTTEPTCTFGGTQTTPSDGPNLVRWFAISGLGPAISTEGRSIPKDGIDFFTQSYKLESQGNHIELSIRAIAHDIGYREGFRSEISYRFEASDVDRVFLHPALAGDRVTELGFVALYLKRPAERRVTSGRATAGFEGVYASTQFTAPPVDQLIIPLSPTVGNVCLGAPTQSKFFEAVDRFSRACGATRGAELWSYPGVTSILSDGTPIANGLNLPITAREYVPLAVGAAVDFEGHSPFRKHVDFRWEDVKAVSFAINSSSASTMEFSFHRPHNLITYERSVGVSDRVIESAEISRVTVPLKTASEAERVLVLFRKFLESIGGPVPSVDRRHSRLKS